MVNRARPSLIPAAVLALSVILLGGFAAVPDATGKTDPGQISVGERIGTTPRPSAPEVHVHWVVRASDLLACQQLTPELRRLQHTYRDRVVVVAYPIGADTALVRSYLRRERLGRVAVQPLTEREFQRDFAQHLQRPVSTPSLLVSYPGTRAATFDVAVSAGFGRRGIPEFSTYVASLLQPAGLAENTRNPSLFRSGEE